VVVSSSDSFPSLPLASPSEQNKKPLAEYHLAYHPGMLRLEPLVSKIVDSNWIHVANSGIIGSDAECPRLPDALNWACKRGHNLGSHKLARDTCVVETQHTEDESDYARLFQMPHHPASASIQLGRDKSDEIFDFVLVSAGEERYKLLLRVTSESHSRMIDPSRAIIKMARGFQTLRCSHGVKEGVASVPEGHTVELYRFDKLLGRWGALRERKRDPEADEEPLSSEEGSPPDASTQAAKSSSLPQEAQEEKEKIPNPLRITHILDSSFKFNTALVLAGDNPVFVGSGDSCLKCAVDTAISFPLDSYYSNYGRWIICHDPHPSTKMPRSRLQTSRARFLMQEST
jgi:hypothetical protein